MVFASTSEASSNQPSANTRMMFMVMSEMSPYLVEVPLPELGAIVGPCLLPLAAELYIDSS